MRRKFLSTLLALCMLTAFVPCAARAETGTKYGDYLYYELNDDGTGITITDCDENAEGVVTVPSEIDGLPVTELYGWFGLGGAFSYCTKITSVNLPNTLRTIGSKAFSNCTSLKHIIIPDSVISMDVAVFESCTALETVTMPNGIDRINDWMFEYCENLKSVNIPDGVMELSDSAFDGCESLNNISIPESVTHLGRSCFRGCKKLTTIHIPKNVEGMGINTFSECSSLNEITVDEDNVNLCSVDGILYTKNMKELIKYPEAKAMDVFEVPDTVTEFSWHAISYTSSLKKVILPEHLLYLYHCFNSCLDLESVSIPSSIIDFSGCFKDCPDLKEIKVSEDNTNYCDVDGVLFSKDKTSLFVYPGGKGDTSYKIDSSISEISPSAFYDCTEMKEITVDETNENYCDVIGVLFNKDKTMLVRYPAGNTNTIYTVPESVNCIGQHSFVKCRHLQAMAIGDNVKMIEAFSSNPFEFSYALKDIYYSGSEEQWSKIKSSTNFYIGADLINGTIHFNSVGVNLPKINDVTQIGGDIKISLANVEYDSDLIAVFNSESGMIDFERIGISAGDTEKSAAIPSGAKSVKVFIWDSLNGMRPLCEAAEADIT